MLKKAIGIEPRPKVAKPVEAEEEEEEESEEESDDEEKDSPGKPKSGQGRGKDIGNHSSEDEDEDGANGSLSAHEGEIMCIWVYYAEAGVASGRAHAARTALGKLVPMLGPRPATAAGRSQAGSQADFEYVILPARHIISRACCIESRWATTPSRHKCVYSWPTKSKWPEWAGGRANDPALNVEVCAGCEHCA